MINKILICQLIIACFGFGFFVGRETKPEYTPEHAKAIMETIERGTHFELRSLRLQRELNQCEQKGETNAR